MFTFTAKKMFFALTAVCALALSVQSASAVEVGDRNAQKATALEQEAENVRQRADSAVDNLGNRARNYEDRIKMDAERIEDRANVRADNLDKRAESYTRSGSDDWFGGTTTRDRQPVNDRLDYMQATEMSKTLNPETPSPAYRTDLSARERERVTDLEKKRNEEQQKYFEKRRDLESKLNSAPAGSAEAKSIEEDLWDLENDFSRQQVRFQNDIKDYVRK